MTTPLMILYVKTGCLWRHRAEVYLQKREYCYQSINVRKDKVAFDK